MFRYLTGMALLASFIFAIIAAGKIEESRRELRLDIAICTLIFGASGVFLCYSGRQVLRFEKTILKMSFDMLESYGYIDVNKLSMLTQTPQVEIIQFLKKAQIDNYIKKETSLFFSN